MKKKKGNYFFRKIALQEKCHLGIAIAKDCETEQKNQNNIELLRGCHRLIIGEHFTLEAGFDTTLAARISASRSNKTPFLNEFNDSLSIIIANKMEFKPALICGSIEDRS